MKKFLKKKVILIQLNEINFELADQYIKKNNLKTLEKIVNFNRINTYSESEYELLEPWIQWASFSTGKEAKEHRIFRLGDIKNVKTVQIYEKIEQLGFSVGAVCPMNTENRLKKPAFFISDPWTNTQSDKSWWSKKISRVLSRVVNNNSQEKVSIFDFSILFFAIIRFSSLKSIFIYITLFLKSFRKKYMKVFILELLITDLAKKFLKKNVNFASFFYNGGAHIQHHYFFNSNVRSEYKNPEWYIDSKLDPFEEILIFYDQILSFYLEQNYNLIVATGLRQIPFNGIDFYYRLKNHNQFLKKLGLKNFKVSPRMTRDFLIEFINSEDADKVFNILNNIFAPNGDKIFGTIEKREKSLFVTLTYKKEIKKNFEINILNKKINFYDHVVFVAIKNGMHDGRGYIYSNFLKKMSKSIHIKDLHKLILNEFSQNEQTKFL